MLFSYSQLAKLVDLKGLSQDEVIQRLTFSGFEVEGVEHLAQASKLVIGKILTCEKHPDSDHLHLLTVDCGQEGIKNIVCGAPNARVGIKVIVALEGCVLPALSTTIKKGKVRGFESEGMCCSLLELGVNKETLPASSPSLNGIEELPIDAPVGEREVLSYLGLDDVILDINVLPNRPDCLSYIGMARELASLFSREVYPLPTFDFSSLKSDFSVKSETDLCPRFDVLKISNIKPKEETPLFIRRVLEANGIRSLNPLVDIGNYAMLLTGEPFNIYSEDEKKRDYICSDAFEGEFNTFDSKKLSLIPSDLVILDGERKPLCLAGIMAGDAAFVTPETKNIAVEAAVFYHANIRHTSARVGLSSPSSQLFAKGRNQNMIPEALSVFISLLDEFFLSYELTSYASDVRVEKHNAPFAFSYEKLNERLGTSYSKEEIKQVLDAYRIEEKDGMLYPPLDRVDLLEQCDIEEEVFRYYPAKKVNPSLEHFPLSQGALSFEQKSERMIKRLLIERGYDEILSFTLISEKEHESLAVFQEKEPYRVLNPMTKDHEIVRSDLLPSMLLTLRYNLSHQHKNLSLFEISPVDTKDGTKTYLSLGLAGETSLTEDYKTRPFDFFDLKGVFEAVMEKMGIGENRYRLSYTKNPKFHPKAACDVFLGKDLLGTFGKLHPSVCKENILLAEFDLSLLFRTKGQKTKFSAFSSFPSVRRDLSFKLVPDVDYLNFKRGLMKGNIPYLADILYFDNFLDKETGEKYLGISLILEKPDGTLKEEEINNAVKTACNVAKQRFGMTLKGE